MDKNPIDNISELIRTGKVIRHKNRQEFLCSMVEGVIKSRSVIFSEIADKIDKPIKQSSIERRIQDFFAKVSIDYQQLAAFLMSFVPHDQLTLSIDRTEWDFGQTQVNVLCAVVSIGKMAVPVYFEMLDNNSGTSNAADRINLFKSLINIVGKDHIQMLVMDREFIGHKWLSCGSPPGLKKEHIPFCVRVPKSHSILLVNGELLYLISTTQPQTLANWYKRRWSIEVFFQALKQRGFNLEDSSLRSIEKYRKLFALVSMAYTICWATGIEDGRRNPVRTKKHGYPTIQRIQKRFDVNETVL
jgi:hypothetical protein